MRRIFEEKKIPKKMKRVRIRAIKKSNNYQEWNQNRPLNIENADMKLCESIMLAPILENLLEKNYFNKLQFGFIPGRCRVQNLLLKAEYLMRNIVHNEACTIFLFDIKSAFDTTNDK